MLKLTKASIFIGILIVFASCASQRNAPQTGQNSQQRVQGSQRSPGGQNGRLLSFGDLLSQMDKNDDGKISKSEAQGRLASNFSQVDSNNDGFITETEMGNAPRPQRGRN